MLFIVYFICDQEFSFSTSFRFTKGSNSPQVDTLAFPVKFQFHTQFPYFPLELARQVLPVVWQMIHSLDLTKRAGTTARVKGILSLVVCPFLPYLRALPPPQFFRYLFYNIHSHASTGNSGHFFSCRKAGVKNKIKHITIRNIFCNFGRDKPPDQ